MEKLLPIIFLSLLVACGRPEEPKGEEFSAPLRRGITNGAPWPEVKIEKAQVFSAAGILESEEVSSYETDNENFYEEFKKQYKNSFYALRAIKFNQALQLKVDDLANARIFLNLVNREKAKNLRLSLSNKLQPEKKIYIDIDQETSGPIEIKADLSQVGKGPSTLILEVENFTYNLKGKDLQYQTARKRARDFYYQLHIDDGYKVETFFAPAGQSIEETLLQYNLSYEADRKLALRALMEKEGLDWEQDINTLSDNAAFWRVINTPSQRIDFRPIAGQEILIKRIKLGDLRRMAAEKRIRTLKLNVPFIPAVDDPKVHSRKILSVEASLLIPIQKKSVNQSFCGAISLGRGSGNRRSGPTRIERYELAYEKVKRATPAYLFSEVGTKSYDLEMRRPPLPIMTGSTYQGPKKCANKKYKTRVKNYPHRYEVSVKVEERLKL